MSNAENITVSEASEGSLLALWSVPKDGYRITSDLKYVGKPGRGTDPPFLVPNGEVRKVYPVLRNKLLHRNFAKLDNEDSILGFANKYGLLGRSLLTLCSPGGGGVVGGESLSLWKDRINTFGRLLAIWDLVKNREVWKLRQFVLWPRPDRVLVSAYWIKKKEGDYTFYSGTRYRDFETFRSSCVPQNVECGFESQILADRNKSPELLRRWRQGDFVEPALYYVCYEVNKNLDSQFSFKILPFVHKEIYTQPKTLESVMWLMFAYEMNDRIKPIQCATCSQWFQQYDGRQRHCSNACKQKAWRLRNKAKGVNHNERSHKETG